MKHTICLIFLLTIATQHNTYSSFQEKIDNYAQATEKNEDEVRQRYGLKNVRFDGKGSMFFQLANQNRKNIDDTISSIHYINVRRELYDECLIMEATHDCIERAGAFCCCYSCLLAVCFSLTNIKKTE